MNTLRIDKTNVDKIAKILKERNEVIPAVADPVFKTLFRDKDMKGILSLLISRIIKMDESYIKNNLIYEDSYLGKKKVTYKENTVDLIVKIENSTIMLEMNEENGRFTRFINTSHFHSGVSDKFLVSKGPKEIGRLYQINFDNKHPFSNKLISRIMMRDDDGKIDEDETNFRKYKVNLSYFDEMGYNIEKLDKFERILLILREKNRDKLKELAGKDKELIKMVKKIEEMSEARKIFDIEAFNEHVAKLARMAAEDEAREKGLAKGLSEGIAKGLAEGKAQGIAEGRAEAEKETKIKTAKKLLENNVDINIIIDSTGLSEKELENLQK